MFIEKQTFLVMGLSRSGMEAAEFLLEKKGKVYLYDDTKNDKIRDNTKKLISNGGEEISAEQLEEISDACDVLVLSPGVPIDNPVPVLFRRKKKRIIGESELGAIYVKALSVGITGTNGKTTTVSMLNEVIKATGRNCAACGNIGNPYLACRNLGENDFAVVEISSFQLETLSSFKPHIAVILNISEDHLNRHYNMDNYIFLKKKILKNSTESEYAVLNADDETVASFAKETKAKVKFFSLERKVDGAYLNGTSLMYGDEEIIDIEQLKVTGKHNVENALACICAAKILGIENNVIADALKNFKGISHRIEIVDKINGVTYIDDSKATNVDATIKAIEGMKQETVLMLGGKDKGYDYSGLFEKLKESFVIQTVIYGENRFKILSAAIDCGYDKIILCNNFDMAFSIIKMIVKPAQTVLLSPASASFDEFSSFEERGDKFKKLVSELKRETENIDGGDDEEGGE